MIQLLGFDSDPHCIIWWHKNGVALTKTVCYSDKSKKAALNRFTVKGDFYNKTYDAAVVDYGEDNKEKIVQECIA